MLEVEGVVRRAAGDPSFITTMNQIDKDWEYGHKGIVKEAVHGKKLQRPRLVIDPEDRVYL